MLGKVLVQLQWQPWTSHWRRWSSPSLRLQSVVGGGGHDTNHCQRRTCDITGITGSMHGEPKFYSDNSILATGERERVQQSCKFPYFMFQCLMRGIHER